MDEEKQKLQQGEAGDGGQRLGCFMYPVSPESFFRHLLLMQKHARDAVPDT